MKTNARTLILGNPRNMPHASSECEDFLPERLFNRTAVESRRFWAISAKQQLRDHANDLDFHFNKRECRNNVRPSQINGAFDAFYFPVKVIKAAKKLLKRTSKSWPSFFRKKYFIRNIFGRVCIQINETNQGDRSLVRPVEEVDNCCSYASLNPVCFETRYPIRDRSGPYDRNNTSKCLNPLCGVRIGPPAAESSKPIKRDDSEHSYKPKRVPLIFPQFVNIFYGWQHA